jgi:hypothetical protein
MTTDRKTALAGIAVGDLFHATTPNRASLICRAMEVSATTIRARTVTSQYALEFDRARGVATPEIHGERVPCTIDSVAPIPGEVRTALMGLDAIYSVATSDDEGHKLTESERRALVFAALYYPAHPILQSWEMMDSDRKVGPARDPEDYDGLTGDQKIDLILVNYLIPMNKPRC